MARVLIIEDEKAMSDLVAIKFRVEGFEVDQAGNLTEAKNLVSTNHYDAILSDYLLPDGDLTDFLTFVRSNPSTANLKTIIMTNYVEDVNVEKLKTLGVVEVLVKYQVVPAQMVEKIKALIGGGQPQPGPAAPPAQ